MISDARLLAAIRAIIHDELPELRFAGVYEYAVQSATDASADLAPTDPTIGLPTLAAVRLCSSVLGERGTPSRGAVALVEFLNGDPRRPDVISVGPTIVDGTIDATGELDVGASAAEVDLGAAEQPVTREGDAALVYFDAGATLPILGTITTPPAVPYGTFLGTLTIGSTPCPGVVGPGSSKVTA